jgi:hypothetical protein
VARKRVRPPVVNVANPTFPCGRYLADPTAWTSPDELTEMPTSEPCSTQRPER